MNVDSFTRRPGPRFVVRGWDGSGRMADPIYTDDRAAARDAVATLGRRIPSGVFVASDATTNHQLASCRRGTFCDH